MNLTTLGLRDTTFLSSGPGNNGGGDYSSLRFLIGMATSSLVADLLGALNKIKGFGNTQDQGGGAKNDPTPDTTKLSGGHTDNDHTVKSILKDFLKPNG
ncbi:hypothetical protein [Mesorhizobium sp. CU2]|uniref:hypothetical protein n=1 Tax=Mesorhizobium sp. CU2 TaxID=2589985 RepID=UPI0015E378FC|nr:hypothetical protein [Mesorhizobium sp. CU2]